jgi:hypothetical protein
MIPYFIVFFICFLLTLFDFSTKSRNVKNLLLIGYGVLIVFFAGIRWETGTDWENYVFAFYVINNNTKLGVSGYELFYELFVFLSSTLIKKYTFILFTTASTIYLLTASSVKKYSPYPLFSFLLLLSYSINSSGFGYRQDLAIAITFFSLYYIINNKVYHFIALVIIATFFHQSAIVFLPAYWIAKINWNRKKILILFFFLTIIYFLTNSVSDIAAIYSDTAEMKVSAYTELDEDQKTMGKGDPIILLIKGLSNRLVLFIPALLLFYKNKENVVFKGILNIFIFGISLYVIFSPLGAVFLRFSRYFDIFHILLIPLAVYFSKGYTRIFLFLFYLIFCIIKFSLVLLNDENVYVPYKTIFS